MIIQPAERITGLPEQMFARLVQQVEARRHQGLDVINLGQGNPDQPTPDRIVRALQAAAENPRYHRYIPFSGLAELKQAVAAWYQARHGVTLDPDREVAILIGSKIGLQELALCLLNPGDVALVPDPGYPDYWSGIRLAQGTMLPLRLKADMNFLPDLDEWHPQARLAFVNYPNNPTGRLAPPGFYDDAIRQAARFGTVIAHDLAYGDIVYDGLESVSLLSRPGGKDVGVEFTTLSKSYNMAGWRLGFAAGHHTIIRLIELLQDHLHCSQFGAVQAAGIAALSGPEAEVVRLRELFQARRDRFLATAAAHGWDGVPASQGSIFMWCPVPGPASALAWAERLLEEENVMVAPGSGFGPGGEGYIRISLTESAERLESAAIKIARALARHAAGQRTPGTVGP
ncbi:MAG: aminotransferase class I/II-fold pyridoxal phosphate-dependent enzyme [Thermaerobacter sp.]|nr:aminotransferase class I/II-fold pyridoxal phosphate-dependent enzyme [Thermaerobacter sp.]